MKTQEKAHFWVFQQTKKELISAFQQQKKS